MSWYGKNRFKNLTAEYVSESTIEEVKESIVATQDMVDDVIPPEEVNDGIDLMNDIEKEGLTESAYIDSLLEALDAE